MVNSPKSFGEGVLKGLVTPSLCSLITALLTIAAIIFSITPYTISLLPPEYLMLKPRDEAVIVTQKLYRLKTEPSPPLSVTLIGASSLREALIAEQDIAHRLSTMLNTQVAVTQFVASDMRPWELACLSDHIPLDFNGIVVVCLSLEYDPQEIKIERHLKNRFAVNSSSFDAEIRQAGHRPPRRTGIYLYDHFHYFSIRSAAFLKSMVFGPIAPQRYFWDGVKLSRGRNAMNVTAIGKRAATSAHLYINHAIHNWGSLARNLAQLKRDNLYVVYLFPPRNHELLEPLYQSLQTPDLLRKMNRDAERNTRAVGVDYWNFNQKGAFGYQDFGDDKHLLNTVARTRFSEMLIERLARIFQTRFKKE